jgi:hypothetical protein
VQHAERRLVAFDPEHLLELERGHTGSQGCNKEGTPEPCAERHLAVLHYGAGSQPSVSPATPASQPIRPTFESKCIPNPATVGTREAVRKANGVKVGGARLLVGEQSLKFGQGLRCRQDRLRVLDVKQYLGQIVGITCLIAPVLCIELSGILP